MVIYGQCSLMRDSILLISGLACGTCLNECLSMGEGQMESFLIDKEEPKNKPHQITLALNLTAFKFNDLIILYFF